MIKKIDGRGRKDQDVARNGYQSKTNGYTYIITYN